MSVELLLIPAALGALTSVVSAWAAKKAKRNVAVVRSIPTTDSGALFIGTRTARKGMAYWERLDQYSKADISRNLRSRVALIKLRDDSFQFSNRLRLQSEQLHALAEEFGAAARDLHSKLIEKYSSNDKDNLNLEDLLRHIPTAGLSLLIPSSSYLLASTVARKSVDEYFKKRYNEDIRDSAGQIMAKSEQLLEISSTYSAAVAEFDALAAKISEELAKANRHFEH